MKKIVKYIFLGCYILFSFYVLTYSLQSGEDSSNTSDSVTDVVIGTVDKVTNGKAELNYEDTKIFVRKVIGHFGGFFVIGLLGIITYFLFFKKIKLTLLLNLGVGLLLAITAELLQFCAEGRSPQVKDVIIDYFGIIIGSGIGILFIFSKFKAKKNKICDSTSF